jgi:hypothetical protein
VLCIAKAFPAKYAEQINAALFEDNARLAQQLARELEDIASRTDSPRAIMHADVSFVLPLLQMWHSPTLSLIKLMKLAKDLSQDHRIQIVSSKN